jgi:hypothetical protein
MVKLTIWIKQKKRDNPVNFDSEDFLGETIYKEAIELSDQMCEAKIRLEKITKGGEILERKQFVKETTY